jgi:hypothetical protein
VVAVGGVLTALLATGVSDAASTIAGLIAAAAAVSLVAGVSVVWPGLDAQETQDGHVGVGAADADGRRYARVNTTDRRARHGPRHQQPESGGAERDAGIPVLDSLQQAHAHRRRAADGPRRRGAALVGVHPAGTTDVVTAADYVAYRTDSGAVFVGRLSVGAGRPARLPSRRTRDAPQYTADAIAVG